MNARSAHLAAALAALAASTALAAPCILTTLKGETAVLANGTSFTGAFSMDDCAKVHLRSGTATAVYFDKTGKLQREAFVADRPGSPQNMDPNSAPAKAVARSLFAVLTDGKAAQTSGKKFFDKPSQIGAPFGDVYVPVGGLTFQFTNLEPGARVVIAAKTGNASVLQADAALAISLSRAQLQAGQTYALRVQTAKGNLPQVLFEVVSQAVAEELDKALQVIDTDHAQDPNSRAVARALVFEREGLSFNRDLALKEISQ